MTHGSVPIPPLERSLYEAATPEEKLKTAIDALVEATGRGANWKVRKKTLLDIIGVIDFASSPDAGPLGLEAEDADAAMEADATAPESADELDGPADFVDVLPLYIGAALERLGETRIACVEQAAFYLLSAHPEHQLAADSWLRLDYRHARDFKKFMKANRYYRDVLDRGFASTPEWSDDDAVD